MWDRHCGSGGHGWFRKIHAEILSIILLSAYLGITGLLSALAGAVCCIAVRCLSLPGAKTVKRVGNGDNGRQSRLQPHKHMLTRESD